MSKYATKKILWELTKNGPVYWEFESENDVFVLKVRAKSLQEAVSRAKMVLDAEVDASQWDVPCDHCGTEIRYQNLSGIGQLCSDCLEKSLPF
ncbi:hypothetical protein SAMN04487866_1262 [Thermoactinomyces sp. DSM 45891]|uniref:hypothetical protein n=1 Tax=Thermoactinomyces sp. DSM 45891 TaxID=1761907 RepID=UPI00091D7BD7|nr:hypothetical protein [Thermoactinomyces sp. DSM 45891]SFX79061.1 hypothetical protein SAMN04487866_1262 [Thermoactinomyces sp. DSM 45891]